MLVFDLTQQCLRWASTIKILAELQPRFFEQAANIYDEAFGEKFARAIPNASDRIQVLESCFLSDFAFVAVDDEQVLGLAGFNTTEGALTGGGSIKNLFSLLGFFATLRAALVFSFYERSPKIGELVMDGIAVNSSYRGKGIGGHLLDCVIEYAVNNGYDSVRLDVVDTNSLAKKLYEKKGFLSENTQQHPFLKRLLGFSSSTTMVLKLIN